MSRLSYRRFCRPSVTGVWKICSEQAQHEARTIISHAVFDEDVLQRFEKNPSTNTRAVGDAVDVDRRLVWNVVRERKLHPLHRQKGAGSARPQRLPSSREIRWFVHQSTEKPNFPAMMFFTDDACFTREGIFNTQNSHVWAEENPHAASVHCHQQRFLVNVWAGIVNDFLIGPYLLPRRLIAHF